MLNYQSLKSIGEYAFYKTKISKIAVPKGMTSIGKGSFQETKLKKVEIPEICKIDSYAFNKGCTVIRK